MDRIEIAKRRADVLRNYGTITKRILERSGLIGATLKPLKGGYVNVVLLAKKGDKTRVIKIFTGDSLRNEVYWYNQAKKARINAPRPMSYSPSKKILQYDYLLTDFISGKPPTWNSPKLLYRAGLFAGKSLRKLHKIRVGGFGYIKSNGKWSSKTWMQALEYRRHFAINDAAALKVLNSKQIEQIDELTIYNKGLEFKDARLLHGDLYEENVLYSKESDKFSIIDPSSFMIGGDPMYDVSFSLVERSHHFGEGFKDGYKIDELTEKELYRLKILNIFQLSTELNWYVVHKGSKKEIKRYHKYLLASLSSV